MKYPGNSNTKAIARSIVFKHAETLLGDHNGVHIYACGPEGGDIFAARKLLGIPKSMIHAAELNKEAYQRAQAKHPDVDIFHGDIHDMVKVRGLNNASLMYLDLCGNLNPNNVTLFRKMIRDTNPKVWAVTFSMGHETGTYARRVRGLQTSKERVLARHRILQEAVWKDGDKKPITLSAIRYINNKCPMVVFVGRMAAYTGERFVAPWLYWDIEQDGPDLELDNSFGRDVPMTAALKAGTPPAFKDWIQRL